MDSSLPHLAGRISDGEDTGNAEARSGISGTLPTDGPELSEYRPLLLHCVRMLGSVAEAEDMRHKARPGSQRASQMMTSDIAVGAFGGSPRRNSRQELLSALLMP